jgi:hypothetical protein
MNKHFKDFNTCNILGNTHFGVHDAVNTPCKNTFIHSGNCINIVNNDSRSVNNSKKA